MPTINPLPVEKDVTRLNRKCCSANEPSLGWLCAFCGMLRIWEGGRPKIADHCEWCAICGSLVVGAPKDQEAVAKLIDRHLYL
jgi:hypothetical protein